MNQTLQNGTNNDVLTECYDPVAILLSSVNHDTENLTEVLRQCGVKYNQLSGLVEEDLRLMGMSNDKAIQEILSEISTLSNQQRLYDSVIRNEFNPEEYSQTVCSNSVQHMEAMSFMIRLILLKTKVSFPQNVLLEERIYASEFCLQLTDKIKAKLTDIESVLNNTVEQERPRSLKRNISIPLIVISGAVILALVYRRAVSIS
uniref:SAM domain-containing protein n=1 Tax=Anopheles culicifacies TaxID=139723 RepID=A0A182M5Z4_9DIPT